MAMTYQNFASLGVNLNRQKYGPLDISSVFTSEADLNYYLTKGAETEGVSEYWYKNANEKIVPYPYEGQVIATVINDDVKVYVLRLDAEGAFEAKAIEPEVDGKTIKLTNGKLELVGLPTDTSKVYVPSLVNGVLTWAEPDTSTAEGQQQAIEGLTASVAGLSEVLNGKAADEEAGTEAVVGLVDKVAALEAVDNATQAELDAYKEVVTAAIAAGVKEAKEYADAQDADTVYDDAELAGRVSAIEADYLKEEDKYDDTAVKGRLDVIERDYLKKSDETIYDDTVLAGRVTTVEGKVTALEQAVEAIDYVDADELATELAPYAKTADINTELAKKADKESFEALKGTVEAFLTGDGTEAALDSLKELIAYIDEHDGADLTEMIATIEAIEGKLEGIDTTVVAYVTAAIDALKIGDYAKAADLTALAGRVETLEAKPFDTYATKTEVGTVDGKFANYTTTEALNSLLADKADANSVVANETFESFKTTNSEAITAARTGAVSDVEAKGYAVATEVANTYVTKSELTEAVEGIENDLVTYAKTTDVNTELAKKADASSVYTKTEIDSKIGTPGVPAEIDSEGNEVTPAVPGTGVFASAYSRAEVDKLLDEVQGGSSASADSVLRQLNTYKSTNDERVSTVETKNGEQDTAIAKAQEDATKGINDAKKVSDDLATANLAIADNAREIGVVKDSISSVNTTLSGKIATLESKDTEIAGKISGLETTVNGNATTIGEHTAAITALQNKDTELAGLISGVDSKFANYYDKDTVDTKVQEAIDAIPEVSFDGYATEKYVDDAILVVNEEVAKKANATDVYSKTDADAKFLTETQVKSVVDKVVADVTDTDTIEGLVTLVEYVHDNAGDIAQLVSDVDANKTAIAVNKAAHEKNAADIVAINESIAAIVQPKESSEISVATDGTLGIKEVNVNKLVQTEGDIFVLNGGNSAN